MAEEETQTGTYLPEGSYAVTITPEGEVRVIVPSLRDDEPLNYGHLLVFGIAEKLRSEEWANNLIDETAEKLNALKDHFEPAEKVG